MNEDILELAQRVVDKNLYAEGDRFPAKLSRAYVKACEEIKLQRDVIAEFGKATGLMRAEEHPEFLGAYQALYRLQAFLDKDG